MNFNNSFSNKTILIPLLQRDYVQGSNESVIVPFLDYLLNHDCDLNYIYGYSENDAFVPVDGQQRLTTLWLLYLYIHARIQKPFTTKLKFNSREYAEDFCKRLKEKLPVILKNPDFKEKLGSVIEDQCWFIPSWKKNASVRNMLRTLSYIHSRITKENISRLTDRLLGSESSISFSFLDMNETNRLDDDIYVKMNGRGRPLSQFENLKSWMDEKIQSSSISTDWKKYMDNRWTNIFWHNRNKQQEHPEEIDDEQLHCFANLMVLFHIKYPYMLTSSIYANDAESVESLIDYLRSNNEKFEGQKDTEDQNSFISRIADELILQFMNGKVPPLVWFDRLNLMPDQFFRFAFAALNIISKVAEDFNSIGLHFRDDKSGLKPIYSLCMTSSTYATTLPLLYALLRAPRKLTGLYDWLRTLRNLILNTEIERKNIMDILHTVDCFSHKCGRKNIYTLLREPNIKETLSSFNQRQVIEECRKAQSEYEIVRSDFIYLENTRFFEGRVECIFAFLPDYDDLISKITRYTRTLAVLFSGSSNGVSGVFDNNNSYFLRRLLISYPPYYFGLNKSYWSFCNGLNDWRDYVRDGKESNIAPIIKMLEEFSSEDITESSLLKAISNKVNTLSDIDLTNIDSTDPNCHRFHFIKYPKIWEYMNAKLAVWNDDNFNIVLKSSASNNSKLMELRTYTLYQDYLIDIRLEHSYKDYGWKLDLYQKEGTCFFFEKDIELDGLSRKIAIDVFFERRTGQSVHHSEDNYRLTLFPRVDQDTEKQESITELLKHDFENVVTTANMSLTPNGRLISKTCSRAEIIELITLLLANIN